MSNSSDSLAIESFHGARVEADGVRYRVWAPDHARVAVRVSRPDSAERRLTLEAEGNGFFSGLDEQGRAGDLYKYDLGQAGVFPDPASRFQPQGVNGPSEVIDSSTYRWRIEWQRPAWMGQAIYELHVGTFTADGTFLTAISRLDHLVELGIRVIEIMPIADFAGDRNWGYDGVYLYAPSRAYGRPDDLRALIDAAHQRDLAVILDVVYNHFGPAGNYLTKFARDYFHASRETPWGSAINFDSPTSRPVRDFFLQNVAYWLDEYRLDGLRLDATHAIEDRSDPHLLVEIAETAHARGAFVIAEDERNSCKLINPRDRGGYGIDAAWSDDFHHHVRVALTGTREGYFASYDGTIDSLAATLDHGWFYRGQSYPAWKGRSRGEVCRDLPPRSFVYCIENHDQVGNRAQGERLEHVISPESFRAASMLLCLSPYAPLIFMGQEWAASSQFLYFTDHEGELGRAVSEGRKKEFAGLFKGVAAEQIPDPQELTTFVRSKLDWSELQEIEHRQVFALYRECLLARKQWVMPVGADRANWTVSATDDAVILRYIQPDGAVSLLIVAFQAATIDNLPENAALEIDDSKRWSVVLQSESPKFGGVGRIVGSAISTEHVGRPWLEFLVPGAVFLVQEDR